MTWYTNYQARVDRNAADAKAGHQYQAEQLRLKQESEKGLFLGIINPADSSVIASKLKLFLDAGILPDPDRMFGNVQEDLRD